MNKKYLYSIMIVLILITLPNIYVTGAIKISNDSNIEIYSQIPSNIISKLDQDNFEIIYPLSTMPKLIEIDDNFVIKFNADEFDEVYAYISTAYEPVIDEIWLSLTERV